MESKIDKVKSCIALKEKIRLLQEEERGLRLEILNSLFGESNIGSLKTTVGDFAVTGTYGLDYKFNQAEIVEAIEDGLLSEEAESVIKVKYELDKRKYNSLDEAVEEEINEYLIITPSLPQISFKVIEDGD